MAEHNKETDAWLAIRSKVFNVTRYLSFHPGGREELMKGAGKDATELFEQVSLIYPTKESKMLFYINGSKNQFTILNVSTTIFTLLYIFCNLVSVFSIRFLFILCSWKPIKGHKSKLWNYVAVIIYKLKTTSTQN